MRLGEIAEINPKFTGEYLTDDTEVAFLPMKCVEELTGHLNLFFTRRLSEVKKGYTPFIEGDLLFAKITPCMENGKVAIAHGLKNGIGFGSTEFHVIRLPESFPRKLLFFFLIREDLRRDAQRNMTGSAGQLRVPVHYMHQIPIPLPPLPEQHRIVARIEGLFTRLDAGVAALKKIKAQLKRYRQAVLRDAFQGKLTQEWREDHKGELEPASALLERIKREHPKNAQGKYKELPSLDTSDLPDLPEGWVWTITSDVCSSVRDGTHDTPRYVEEGIPLVTSKNLKEDGLDFTTTKNISIEDHKKISVRSGVENGDILFAMIGTVGNPVVVQTDRLFSIKNVGLFKKNQSFLRSKYLKFWLASWTFNEILEKGKLSKGTTQKFIPLEHLRILPLPLSSFTEQHKIVEEIERRLSVADEIGKAVDQSLKQSVRLRQSILKRAFEGKLVPQDPSDEPADKLLERIREGNRSPALMSLRGA